MIITINAPAIMKVREVIFYEGKTLYWEVRGVFHGDRDFFYLSRTFIIAGALIVKIFPST